MSNTRNQRLAEISARLTRISMPISMCENDLASFSMSAQRRGAIEADLALYISERDALIAERTRIHQNPPNGVAARLAEIDVDVTQCERNIANPLSSAWVREKQQEMRDSLLVEQQDLLAVVERRAA